MFAATQAGAEQPSATPSSMSTSIAVPQLSPPAPPRLSAPVVPVSPPPTAAEEASLIQSAKASGIGMYQSCDGYGAPAAVGDGMTQFALRLWRPGGNTSRTTPLFGPYGIGACGAALEDAQAKYPQHWMRRVSLLRARAIHRLSVNDTTGALKDLDAAQAVEAAGGEDILAQRSLGLGVDFVRALALKRSGQVDAGRSLALATWAKRPWNRETARAALVAIGGDAPAEEIERILRAEAQVNPLATTQLFDEYFERGRFADALSVFDALTPPIKLSQGERGERDVAWLEQSNRAHAAEFWAECDGRKAYALAVLGRFDEAKAALQAADARFAGETPPAPNLPPEPSRHDQLVNAVWEQANLEIKTKVPGEIAAWRAIVNARIDVAQGKFDAAKAYLAAPKPTSFGAVVDLMDALSAQDPKAKQGAEAGRKMMAAKRLLQPAAEITALFEALPEAETRSRTVGDQQKRLFLTANGFTITAHPETGLTTIDYRGVNSSLSIMEEEALLKAAELARQAGKNGLIVQARRDIRHTLTTYQYGRAINTAPTGFETQLDVVFVDVANPPPPYDKAKWRLVDVAAVQQSLAPIYQFDEKDAAAK